jgi:acyl dehydratase
MAIDYDKLMNWKFPVVRHRYTQRDSIIYALGIGVGSRDPFNENHIRFLYEKDLVALPSMGSILCYPGNWLRDPDTGVDYNKVMNAGTKLTIIGEIPTEANLISTPKVLQIIDKGVGKGAIILSDRDVYNEDTGDLVCRVEVQTFCRADGGFGGPVTAFPKPEPLPETAPTTQVDFETAMNCHLIYRLNGDKNPLHIEPAFAHRAGFKTPVVHGLCTYGISSFAILDRICGFDGTRIKSIQTRYTAPVFPGDVVRTEIWEMGSRVRFRATVPARGTTALDMGEIELV